MIRMMSNPTSSIRADEKKHARDSTKPELGFEEIRSRRLFYQFVIPGVLVLICFGVAHFVIGNRVEGAMDLIAGIGFSVCFALRATGRISNTRVLNHVVGVGMGALFIALLFVGENDGSRVLWMYLYPVIAFFMMGKQQGLTWSLTVLGVALIFIFALGTDIHPHTMKFNARFVTSYLVIVSMIYVYESARHFFQEGLENRQTALQEEKTKLEKAKELVESANKALMASREGYRKLYEETKKAEEVVRSQLHSSADAVAVSDLKGRIRYVGPVFSRMFGWSPGEVLDQRLPFLSTDADGNGYQAVEAVIRDGTPCQGVETRCVTREGRELDVSLSASRFDDHRGEPAGVFFLLRDVSERKRLEAEFQRAEKMRAIGTLAGGVAHDFNNLMMGMLGNVELMLTDAEPGSEGYRRLQQIEGAIQSGSHLVHQLLGYARKGKYNVRPLDMNRIVSRSVETFRKTCGSIVVRQHLAQDLPLVLGDENQIDLALMSLFTNAEDAMPEGGRIDIATRKISSEEIKRRTEPDRERCFVCIEVSDTGVGMDSETRDRLFEPFFTTKKMGRGTGLGLATVYGIVKGHDGQVTVDSTPGKGTRFSIYFPEAVEPSAPIRPRYITES